MVGALAVAALMVGIGDTVAVSAGWLAERLGRPGVVVVHAAMGREEYLAGHLPGARFASLMDFHAHGEALPPVPQLERAVRSLGIGNDDRVVIVGGGLSAAILFVAFDYLGHGSRTAILDGGLEAWRAAGGAVTGDTVPTPAPSRFVARPRSDMVVAADWVRARLRDPRVALLDGRSEAEYRGTTDAEQLPRAGHIPGARWLEWTATFEPAAGGAKATDADGMAGSRLKPRAALAELFRAAGAEPGDTVVSYCTVGMRASQLYYVARLLGYPARIYVGSMADWSRREELPVAGRSGGETERRSEDRR